MGRIRSIKPEFFTSLDTAGQLTRDTRLHFAGLWTYADDEGRGVDEPRLIKADVWPLDDDIDTAAIEAMQAELARAGRIVRYHVGGRPYFQVVDGWARHQRPNRPKPSDLPGPDQADDTPVSDDALQDHCTVTDDAVSDHGAVTDGSSPEWRGGGEEGRGGEKDDDAGASSGEPDVVAEQFEDFWARYPRHSRNGKPGGGGSRAKALQRWRRMTRAQREQALAAVDHYRAWCERDDGEFAAHATTWLNEQRWEQWQEPAPPPAQTRNGHGREPPRPAGHEPNTSTEPVTARRVKP